MCRSQPPPVFLSIEQPTTCCLVTCCCEGLAKAVSNLGKALSTIYPSDAASVFRKQSVGRSLKTFPLPRY